MCVSAEVSDDMYTSLQGIFDQLECTLWGSPHAGDM